MKAEADHTVLKPEVLKQLTSTKEKFLILMERATEAAKTLDARAITRLAKNYPELNDFVEAGGAALVTNDPTLDEVRWFLEEVEHDME